MSTLTSSSPSPGISPRSSFHIQRSSFTAPPATTKPSPRSTWTTTAPATLSTSPRFNASSAFGRVASAHTSPHIGIHRLPRERQVDSPKVDKTSGYVDAGTQYSPDGYPPTAGGRNPVAPARPQEQQQQQRPGSTSTSPSASKKRKEKEIDSPEPMSTSGGSSAPPSAGRVPPPEPEPRRDPSAPQSGVIAAGPSNKGKQNASEPDPARSIHAATSSSSKRAKPELGTTKVMPILYQNCNAKELGNLISNMLMELIRLNDRIPLRDGRLTRFHSRAPPGISVSDYLQRLIHHATLSPPILLSMVYYIDRLCQLYPIFTINSLTVHRFLITAATVAAKGLSDAFWTNPTYAQIGGIPVSELATLELEFLEKVQWKIVPKPEVLVDYYNSLVERTDGYVLEGEESSSSSAESSEEGSRSEGEESSGKKKEDEEMADDVT